MAKPSVLEEKVWIKARIGHGNDDATTGYAAAVDALCAQKGAHLIGHHEVPIGSWVNGDQGGMASSK